MAVLLGTNCGFVATPPTADPGGTNTIIDTYDIAIKDVCPDGVTTITSVGWYCDNATQETNFEVGLYSHHAGNNKPDARLFVDTTNAKGTDSGWKTASVNWAVTPGTTYWIAVQVDDTATITNTNYSTTADRMSTHSPSTALPNPWDAGSSQGTWARAIYASYGAGPTYSELAGTIAATSAVTGNMVLSTMSALSGTIAATSVVGPASLGQVAVSLSESLCYKRLVAIGNNQVWYEDI